MNTENAKEQKNRLSPWDTQTLKLSNYMQRKDLQNFLRWDVVKNTMFVGNSPYIAKELFFLLTHNWKKWKQGIQENSFGHPTPFILYPLSSGNLIHHAHHLAQFENVTGQNVTKFDHVFEFGGGYGSMARLFYNIGFKGKYTIYDLPEFSQLQRMYLDKIGMKHVTFISKIEDIKTNSKETVLFLATWSLSESPINIRNKILGKISASSYLFAYQQKFYEYDNIEFFNKFMGEHNLKWYNAEIKHIPKNYYSIGY